MIFKIKIIPYYKIDKKKEKKTERISYPQYNYYAGNLSNNLQKIDSDHLSMQKQYEWSIGKSEAHEIYPIS